MWTQLAILLLISSTVTQIGIKHVGIVVPFYTYILEVPGLSLGHITTYPHCSSLGIVP
jgi:hypothetical protein